MKERRIAAWCGLCINGEDGKERHRVMLDIKCTPGSIRAVTDRQIVLNVFKTGTITVRYYLTETGKKWYLQFGQVKAVHGLNTTLTISGGPNADGSTYTATLSPHVANMACVKKILAHDAPQGEVTHNLTYVPQYRKLGK